MILPNLGQYAHYDLPPECQCTRCQDAHLVVMGVHYALLTGYPFTAVEVEAVFGARMVENRATWESAEFALALYEAVVHFVRPRRTGMQQCVDLGWLAAHASSEAAWQMQLQEVQAAERKAGWRC